MTICNVRDMQLEQLAVVSKGDQPFSGPHSGEETPFGKCPCSGSPFGVAGRDFQSKTVQPHKLKTAGYVPPAGMTCQDPKGQSDAYSILAKVGWVAVEMSRMAGGKKHCYLNG